MSSYTANVLTTHAVIFFYLSDGWNKGMLGKICQHLWKLRKTLSDMKEQNIPCSIVQMIDCNWKSVKFGLFWLSYFEIDYNQKNILTMNNSFPFVRNCKFCSFSLQQRTTDMFEFEYTH